MELTCGTDGGVGEQEPGKLLSYGPMRRRSVDLLTIPSICYAPSFSLLIIPVIIARRGAILRFVKHHVHLRMPVARANHKHTQKDLANVVTMLRRVTFCNERLQWCGNAFCRGLSLMIGGSRVKHAGIAY